MNLGHHEINAGLFNATRQRKDSSLAHKFLHVELFGISFGTDTKDHRHTLMSFLRRRSSINVTWQKG